MKRSDIRNSTIYLILFSLTAFALMAAFRKIPAPEQTASAEPAPGVLWSDTLTNRSSQLTSLSGMDAEVSRLLRKWEITGLSLAVMRNDSLVFAKGYGWANREDSVPMTTQSVMRIASASKLVTAAAIMKLREQGKVNLDDKVFGPEGILNDSALTNSIRDPKILDITVDHLLQHKGGFTLGAGDPMFNTAEIIGAKKLDKAPSDEELVKIVLGRRIAPPGSGRHYSNFGYKLLSMIIEKRSGKKYWDYVRENLLAPANALPFLPGTNYYADKHKQEVKYYGPDTVKVPEYNGSGRMVDRVYGGADIHALEGAGGWVTSAPALARFVAAIDGNPGVPDVISKESVDLLTQFDGDEKLLRGWSEGNGKGKLTRTGTLGSTHALIQQYPDGECWVLITNSGVWTGFHFSHELNRFVENMRMKYGSHLPTRDLWNP